MVSSISKDYLLYVLFGSGKAGETRSVLGFRGGELPPL